jgi:hypothetical protein
MFDTLTEATETARRIPLAELEQRDAFVRRHIGPDVGEQAAMLSELGYATRAALKPSQISGISPPGTGCSARSSARAITTPSCPA